MANTTLLERLGFQDPDRRGCMHDEIQIWAYKNIGLIIKEVFPSLQFDPSTLQVIVEYPITKASNGFVFGFVDVYCRNLSIGIEVKTEIPIVGDVIRQVQLYRRFIPGAWIVVSPDDWCRQILQDQGIFFYKFGRNTNAKQLFLFTA